ncbi:MAG: response regulator [Phototrophicaceae bacterium]
MVIPNPMILEDIVVLYELSLAIGTSLDLRENCEKFLQVLVARKNLAYAAIWIYNEYLPHKLAHDHATLIYSIPQLYSDVTALPDDHPLFLQLNHNRPLTFDAREQGYTVSLNRKYFTQGSVALYPLQTIGLLELYTFEEADGFSRKTFTQISSLINKFTNSVSACLSNERNLSEIQMRNRVERELRIQHDLAYQVMQTMGEALVITNASGHIEYANRQFAEFVGLNQTQINGIPFVNFIREPADKTLFMQKTQQSLLGESVKYELMLSPPSGRLMYALVTSVPRQRDQRVDGIITVLTNLTEQKEIERNLAIARDKALEASRVKSDFLATMSHEIRTPMNAIMGMNELLLYTDLDDEQREYATIVNSETHTLLNLINEILDFSKVEAGKMILDVIDFNLRGLIEGIIDTLTVKSNEKRLALMLYIDPDIPYNLMGDSNRLRQAVMNLIGNAIKFTDQGEVTVRIERQLQTDSEVLLRFSVADTGIGISEEGQKLLFIPFTQVDNSNTRRYGGTGLGLAITQRIVQLMGGEVAVSSQFGKGSTFLFEITLKIASSQPNEPQRLPIHAHLLVVDDSSMHRFILRRYFTSWGCEVTECENGEQALNVLNQPNNAGYYDAIVLDISMPKMDGFVLGRIIRANPLFDHLTMIALTAHDSRDKAKSAIELGFAAYLTKPLRFDDLYQTLDRVINKTRPKGKKLVLPLDGAGDEELLTLLLVEDDRTNQVLTREQLRRLGYNVHIVDDGAKAVQLIKEDPKRYPLILMDCQMPVMDGYIATQTIREIELETGNHIPIIAMTANAIQGDREKCFTAGMDDYMSKPVRINMLQDKINRWLKR